MRSSSTRRAGASPTSRRRTSSSARTVSPPTLVAAAGPKPPERSTTRRTLAIVLDDLSLSFEGHAWARPALRRLVDERLDDGDLVSVVRTGGGIGNLQQFTNDKRLLTAAIDGLPFSPVGLGRLLASKLSGLPSGEASPERRSAAQSGEMAQLLERIARLDEFADRERQIHFTLGSLAALGQVVRTLERMPGRKSLLLVSEGFRGSAGNDPDPRVQARMRELLDAAHRAAVVFYAIDPVGLRAYAGERYPGLAEQMQHAGLATLAEETGGLAELQTNDLHEALSRIDQDRRGYYLIGYQPEETAERNRRGEARFHRIRLELKRRARGHHVRARRGFYARQDNPEAVPCAARLEEALLSPFPAVDVPLRLTALFGRDEKGGGLVRCLLLADADKLSFTDRADGRVETELAAGVVSLAATGRLAGNETRTYSVQLTPEAAARARRQGILLTLDLPVEPGAEQIRAAIWDVRSNRGGSAGEFLDVPDLASGRLALSGLLMSGAETPSPSPADGPSLARGDPNLTPAARRFPAGTPVTYAFAVYNARREGGTGRPRLHIQPALLRDGALLPATLADPAEVAAPSPEAPVTVTGALQLAPDLEPGNYTLAVTVLDVERGDNDSAALQWVAFEVTGP